MSSQVAKKHEQTMDRHTGQSQRMTRTDERETEAKASANAGLNLNLGAAVAGIFSGSRKKKSDVDADGSSSTYEHTKGRGYVEGSGVGNLGAIANGEASVADRQRRTVEGTQQQIDHLGLGEQKSIKAAQK